MTGKIPYMPPTEGGLRIKGSMMRYWSNKHQRYIVKSWPRGNGGDTPRRKAAREAFTAATQMIKLATIEERQTADNICLNTPYLQRDILMMNVTNTLWSFAFDDGTTWVSKRMANASIQQLLNSISDIDGTIIVRHDGDWVALMPGAANQVLTIDPDALEPGWKDAQSAGAGPPEQAYARPVLPAAVAGASALACRGNVIDPAVTLNVLGMSAMCTTVAGATYAFAIYEIDGTGKILNTVIDSGAIASPGTITRKTLYFEFPLSVALGVGHLYAATFRRTDGPDNYALPLWGLGTTDEVYPSLPSNSTTASCCRFATIAKANPANGDTFGFGNGAYAIGFRLQLIT